jgi:HEAT repeat protein
MKSKTLISAILIIMLGGALAAQVQPLQDVPPGVASGFQAQRAGDRNDALYAAGKDAMHAGDWQAALNSFSQLIKAGRRVDESLYWQAYSQNKLGERSEALTSISQLKREYPNSRWVNDASALEIEIRQATGRAESPDNQSDCELKMLALNSLMNTDPERAVPILEKFLNSRSSTTCSDKTNDRALFVLSQSDDARATNLMMQIATGKLHPELQMKAIHYIGISGNHEALLNIYKNTNSLEAKKAVLHALGISGGTTELYNAVKNEKDAQLVREAIHSLGIAGGRQQLRDLYASATDADVKRDILHSTIISGDTELQEKVALSDADPKLRAEAIHDLGISGGSSATLMNIYSSNKDHDVRDSAVNALFIKGDAHSLIALAKKETDPEWKKRIVERLSVMGNREATDYLMEILNK